MLKTLLTLIAAAALIYIGACVTLYIKQRDLVYYPQYTQTDASATNFDLVSGNTRLRGWVLDRQGRNPILYFGGNAERIEANRDDFARLFPGHAVYLLAYRGYGASEGTPSEEALFADALALYDRVQVRHAGQPVAVIGRSLGSGIASYVASKRSISKLVLITPFDSLAAVAQSHYAWLPVRWLAKDRYDSTEYLHRHTGPVLILRAGRDQVIPAESTDRLIASLPKPPRVVNLQEADHNTISDDPDYGDALSAFIR